jgi:transposase
VLTNLIPAGAQRDLTAERAAELLRGIRPRDAAGKTLPGLAVDLVTEMRQLDRRIAKAAADIQTRSPPPAQLSPNCAASAP